tara:strand:+ start:1396 stop:1554 length:159 start_codon:yes stop_codon:yes gene_type:complete
MTEICLNFEDNTNCLSGFWLFAAILAELIFYGLTIFYGRKMIKKYRDRKSKK